MRNHSSIILALLTLCAFSLPIEDKSAEYRMEGDAKYRGFDNFGALAEYQSAYELNPDNMENLIRMARIHNDIGRSMLRRNDSAEIWYLKAVDFAQRMVDLFPQRPEPHFWLALTRGSLVPFRGVSDKLEIGRSITQYARKSIEIDSTFGAPYMILGIIYREGARLKWYERVIANTIFGGSLPGTIEESEAMLLKSIELDPGNLFAYFELARTYDQMENRQKSKEYLEKTLALQPHSARERDQQESVRRQLQRRANPDDE